MEKKIMSTRLGMQDDMIRRSHAGGRGLHDHLVRTAEAHRRLAEAIAKGVHWVWTNTWRAVKRLMNGKSREHTPAANGKEISKILGRASVADAFSRDLLGLTQLVRRAILEPYARWRRRRIAIAGLRALEDRLLADIGVKRHEIELAVDGKLANRGDIFSRPDGRSLQAEEPRHELPLAA
jgi:uncharacterized protein YjiS (DUF1127 family)